MQICVAASNSEYYGVFFLCQAPHLEMSPKHFRVSTIYICIWFFVRVGFYHDGLFQGGLLEIRWSFIRVFSEIMWCFIKVVFHQGGLSEVR